MNLLEGIVGEVARSVTPDQLAGGTQVVSVPSGSGTNTFYVQRASTSVSTPIIAVTTTENEPTSHLPSSGPADGR